MPTIEHTPEGGQALTPQEYIRQSFEASDRLAVVIIDRKQGKVIQRVDPAETIATEQYQAWLRRANAHGADIYISQNALRETAQGSKKDEIAAIRHVYLDLDHEGPNSLAKIENSPQVPVPSYVIKSSPGKYQVIWKVEGMTQEQAEDLQRRMVQEFSADPAATDSTRVLRLPGFFNKKYLEPFRVVAEARSAQTYHLADFKLAQAQAQAVRPEHQTGREPKQLHKSPSEREWRWVLKHLERGESIDSLVQKLVDYRDDKPDPAYYARRTVTRAYAHVALSRGTSPEEVVCTISAHPPRAYINGEDYARTVVQEIMEKLRRSTGQHHSPESSVHSQQLGFGVTP